MQDSLSYVAPRTETEKHLAAIWSQCLYLDRVGIHDRFMDLGGDSLLAAQVVERVRRQWANGPIPVQVRLIDFFADPTIAGLAKAIHEIEAGRAKTRSSLVEMQAGSGTPFFCVPGAVGRVWGLRDLASCFQGHMPFYAFDAKEPHEVDVRTHSIPAVAAAYIAEMKQRQPVGPYDIGGVCWAALVGLEMAHQLRAAGDEVRILALFDPNPVGPASYERFFREDVRHRLRQVRSAGFKEGAGLLWSVFRDLERRVRAPLGLIRPARATRQWTATEWHALYGTPEGVALRDKILRDYQPLPYPGPLTVFLAAQNQCGANDIRRSDWQRLAHGECREIAIDGEHMTWTKRPAVTRLAAALLDVLDEVRSRKTSVEINPPVAV